MNKPRGNWSLADHPIMREVEVLQAEGKWYQMENQKEIKRNGHFYYVGKYKMLSISSY